MGKREGKRENSFLSDFGTGEFLSPVEWGNFVSQITKTMRRTGARRGPRGRAQDPTQSYLGEFGSDVSAAAMIVSLMSKRGV